ncbi:ROK family transcriptional regulator [Microbacterium sp.]|uniref:ROK family transcriptional regulator n=1 Tax=Microbacterium sp. TaxID=51671 RepID=UPI003F998955
MPMSSARIAAPRPEVLASITDRTVLTAVANAAAPVSRAEIATITGLSKPGAAAAAKRLLERGILHEVGIREGRRGGVATLFELDPDHGRSLAVVIQSNLITVESRDLTGTVRVVVDEAITADATPAEIVTAANSLIEMVTQQHPAPVLAAAVSIADPVDYASGTPIPRERSVFPAAAFSALTELDLPESAHVAIDNDVNWATLGEYRRGELRGEDDFVYIYLGSGLGAGLMLGGQLFRGRKGLAGEIGYLRADSAGRLDLTQRLVELGLGDPGRYEIDLERASAMLAPAALDPEADAVIDEIAHAVANIVILLNPSAIALGGPLSVYPAFTDQLAARVESLSVDPPRFVRSDSTPLLGAGTEAHRSALSSIGLTDADARRMP